MSLRRWVNLAGFLLCAAMIGFAYYLQYGPPRLEPCPLCIFERVAVAALGLVFLIAFLHDPRRWGRWVYVVLIFIVAGIGIFIAARHVYIQMHPETVMSCGGASLKTMIEHLPFTRVVQLVLRGSGECAHIDRLLGFTLPGWVLVATIVLGVAGVAANIRRR
ncbi:MAG: disulfide bond formation protein B [Gammaproteobacteria bacterium]|nr:disulfide bond formation protein B [Gammaproteobacteria bacterium]